MVRDIRLAVLVAVSVTALIAFGAWRIVSSNRDADTRAECAKLLYLPLGSPQYDSKRFNRLDCPRLLAR